MVWRVIETQLRRLRHNRVEWLLTFAVPVAFFSIFALIFTRGVGSTPRIKVALVDEVNDDESNGRDAVVDVFDLLADNDGVRVVGPNADGASDWLTRDDAEQWVRRGKATIAVIAKSNASSQGLDFELLNDSSDQVASKIVSALVIQAAMSTRRSTATPDSGAGGAEGSGDGADRDAMDKQSSETESSSFDAFVGKLASRAASETRPPEIKVVNVIGEGKSNPTISVYAAGIAVMFLLFGATSGGGMLLEEQENQTLERLLATHLTMDHLLLGKWFYLTGLGCVQVTVMFLWAQLVFGLELAKHLDGFVMMTFVTSAAAASFGLFLATLCKTRGQLNGLSVVSVLTMSALGGSMVPRYVMSESLQRAGLYTFNAWALDGYDKVFWRELPVGELAPQLTVLLLTSVVLLLAARVLAIRWERV
ncbi:MAG: ABC transporter permease [Planctomycetota bacterium]